MTSGFLCDYTGNAPSETRLTVSVPYNGEAYMALEDALIANTKAIEAHTAALLKLASGAGGTTAASGGGKTTSAAGGKKTIKPEEVQAAFGKYLSVSDEDERNKRKAKIVKLNEHFGVAKISALDPSKFAEALECLTKIEAGEMFADEEPEEESLV